MTSAIVVGSGPNGLAAAVTLAVEPGRPSPPPRVPGSAAPLTQR
jgi:hypothetical protein